MTPAGQNADAPVPSLESAASLSTHALVVHVRMEEPAMLNSEVASVIPAPAH